MKRAGAAVALLGVALVGAVAAAAVDGPAHAEVSGALTSDQAVALALSRNRDVIAARMDIEAAELDVVAARVYPNPTLDYTLGNLVLGKANTQPGMIPPVTSGLLGQPVQSIGVAEVIDVWSKRGARIRAADRGIEQRRLQTEDALREIVYAVRSAFADVLRAQSERDMARDMNARYAETVRLSRARFKAGDIAEIELRKIELEGLRYGNAVIDGELQLDLGRQHLAVLMGLQPGEALPADRLTEPDVRPAFDLQGLTDKALERRPDLRAAGAARSAGEARLTAAEREAYPDLTLGATYTHSSFQVSGDNPNSLALSLSLPLPLFDRNQANIGRARLDVRRADNDALKLRLAVANDVAQAVRKATRAQTLLAIFERPAEPQAAPGASTSPPTGSAGKAPAAGQGAAAPAAAPAATDVGGMLARAEAALRVAEKSYKAGAVSLLDLLEAQRTYLDTRSQYLRAVHDFRQATIDVAHAVGE